MQAILPAMEQLANPESGSIGDVINLDRYCIDAPGSPSWNKLVAGTRTQLGKTGLVSLPGFLTSTCLENLAEEVSRLVPHVPIRRHRASVYHRPNLTGGEPGATELEWFAGHVTRDMIPPFSGAHRLYVSAVFKQFIAACVDLSQVFEYADPLAGLVATIVPPGGQYPWHYDTNEFVVTIMTQQPDAGGEFEYAKDLRTPGNENLDGLDKIVVDGDRTEVRVARTNPGDLQLFLGRYSLHQVKRVEGARERHVLVFSYADRPGVIGPVDRTRSVYGRVTEAHLVAEQHNSSGNDGLIL